MPSYAIEVNGETIMLKDVTDEKLVKIFQEKDLGRYEKERVVSTMAERFVEKVTDDDEIIKIH